ncbi:MAG TPA: DEAD/DEAH box helicase family protein [Gemmatales bacterium]|nr:DEAD/DEAH box helicase family protein [Gemmatales bacterium]
MSALALKEYQQDCLNALASFSDAVREAVNKSAMRPVHDAFYQITGRDFSEVPQMPGIPYVCLRVPTGGGKTLIAAHGVGVVAKHLGHQDRPLCLWVTPSTTIRDQTLRGLRDRNHAYHQAMKEALGVPLEVLTLEEALSASSAMMSSSAVIVVTTIQSYRIDEESNRKIYQDNGYLMDHFTNLPVKLKEQLKDQKEADGRVKLSLANAMMVRGPIVIMDEAHNARTKTSFDSLARMGPLAVIELTATPIQEQNPTKDVYASNVLHAVSALQLKREGMIKLPVDLESRKDWIDVLATTVQTRATLAKRAKAWEQSGGRYVRPIALIQAQPKNRTKETHTVEKVKEALVNQLKVPVESIRIATGDKDELGDEDLSLPECQVDFVITVDKLREGWDCPFAYVLGSVGNVSTETAVEQLLGRILRMPHATPTGIPELDRAYAIVQSEDVAKTAANLADSMVNRCGFDKESIKDVLRVKRSELQGNLSFSSIPVSAPVNIANLPQPLQSKVRYESSTKSIQVVHDLSKDELVTLKDALPNLTDKAAVEEYWQLERQVGTPAKNLDQYAQSIRLPQLAVRDKQQLLRFEPIELEEFSWDLEHCDHRFSEFTGEFHIGDRTLIDVIDKGAVRVGSVEEVIVRQQTLWATSDHWDKVDLVRWFDQELHRGGINAGLSSSESQPWLNHVLNDLLNTRKIELPILVRKRHELIELIKERIEKHGRQQISKAASALFASESDRRLETTWEMPFEITEQDYAPYKRYTSGPYSYQKHAFDLIGHLGPEESACAKKIDDHPNVKRWLRNLVFESAGGFSLPLSPGRFFPDFLVELQDGRIAIVEYKGSHLASNPKELHKKEVGELWAARSEDKGIFIRIVDKDWDTLEKVLNKKPTG